MEITRLVLEISESCNAACPACMRLDENDQTQVDLQGSYRTTPEDIDRWISGSKSVWSNLERIDFTGRFGDAMTNKHIVEIVDRIRQVNRTCIINIQTNGSTGTLKSFRALAADANVKIQFAIDGTDQEVNSMYRRNTNFNTIMKNTKAFIKEGGWAEWIFLVFKHNEHQAPFVEPIAKNLGFRATSIRKSHRFELDGVNILPQGNNIIKIYPPVNSKLVHPKYQEITTGQPREVRCAAHDRGYIYISPRGIVLPCYQYAELLFPNQPAIYNTPGVQEIVQAMTDCGDSLDSLKITERSNLKYLLENSKFLNYMARMASERKLNYSECREKCSVNVEKFFGDYYGWEYKAL
jgi:MoaA/NifB/PqqE/SkfB family radical SAM enzyme